MNKMTRLLMAARPGEDVMNGLVRFFTQWRTTERDIGVSSLSDRFSEAPVVMEQRADGAILLRSNEGLGAYPLQFHDYLEFWARRAPGRVFMGERAPNAGDWIKLTYAEAAQKSQLIAANLASRDLGPDKPVLILSGNSLEHQLLALGCMKAGVPYAPISVAYSLVSQDLGKLKHIVKLLDPGLVYAADAALFSRALNDPVMEGRDVFVGKPSPSVPRAQLFSRLLDGAGQAQLEQAQRRITSDTIVKFLFTSGSTGTPKAVATTQRMLCVNHQQLAQIWPFMQRRPPVLVDWLPWSHVFGSNCNVGLTLRHGGTLWIDGGKPIPGEFAQSIRNLSEISPTAYFNVPRGFDFLHRELVKDDALRKRFFSNLDMMFYAAAALPEHLWLDLDRMAAGAASAKSAPSMITGWGLTETAPAAIILSRHAAVAGNLGAPVPGVEVKLVPNGNKHEVRVRGPNIMQGYWRMEEATRKVFDEEGYFITGDAMRFIGESKAYAGLRFDGRITEDFKLSSGTWVDAAGLRASAHKALAGLVFDVVIAAPNRDDLGLLIFPVPSATVNEDYRARILEGIRSMNMNTGGSSQTVARAAILRDPPSLDKGEITDKGSLNVHAVLDIRGGIVDDMYKGTASDDILVLA
jgi:feruloyl-CoA synthase